jgi:uncharacterized protein YjbI with pentapeptide repeats
MHIHPVPFFDDRSFRVDPSACFVLMPFEATWSRRIWEQLKGAVEAEGYACHRADDYYGKVVVSDIWQRINEAGFVIADLTEANPNVYYELGLAHALGKDLIPLMQTGGDVPFDQLPFRILFYEDNADGYKVLEERLPKWIEALTQLSSPAAMLKLGRIDQFNRWRAERSYVQLSREDFSALDLSGLSASGVLFTESLFVGAELDNANLRDANLIRCDLTGVRAVRADLRQTNASEANLSQAILNESDLRGAVLLRTRLDGASLMGADADGLTVDHATFTRYQELFRSCRNSERIVIESG